MNDDWQSHLDDWSDELPSQVRSQSNHRAIVSLGDDLRSLRVEFTVAQRSCARSEERLDYLVNRVSALEEDLSRGTNAVKTRVALLERQDETFKGFREEDKKEIEQLKALISLVRSFPLGIKGLISFIIICNLAETVKNTRLIDFIEWL
ncbi:MAG: hypothetical protein ACKO1W_02155 [Microcystaceae cyanobacterium]